MICPFPEEVIFDILVKLEADKVYKFKSVCRSWYKLIHDPFFIQLHLKNSTPGLIINLDGKHFFKDMKDRINTSQDLEFGNIGTVLSSCNGLVLLKTKSNHLSIANLITKQVVNIPSPSAATGVIFWDVYRCGFTYVPKIGIYKLVRLLRFSNGYSLTFEVLSLGSSGSKTWRSVNASSLSLLGEKWEISLANPVCINGIVYFVNITCIKSSSVHIISFDAGAESLHMIPTPIPIFTNCDSLVELGGMASLVQATHGSKIDEFNIWILKDWLKGTWVKQHTISITKPLHKMYSSDHDHVKVLPSFSHGGRKVLVFEISSSSGSFSRRLYSHITYDFKTNQLKTIQLGDKKLFFPLVHVNSLISPESL